MTLAVWGFQSRNLSGIPEEQKSVISGEKLRRRRGQRISHFNASFRCRDYCGVVFEHIVYNYSSSAPSALGSRKFEYATVFWERRCRFSLIQRRVTKVKYEAYLAPQNFVNSRIARITDIACLGKNCPLGFGPILIKAFRCCDFMTDSDLGGPEFWAKISRKLAINKWGRHDNMITQKCPFPLHPKNRREWSSRAKLISQFSFILLPSRLIFD